MTFAERIVGLLPFVLLEVACALQHRCFGDELYLLDSGLTVLLVCYFFFFVFVFQL
jgi:hypothetical protein